MSNVRRGDGPEAAEIMIVGECWGESEESSGLPFVGYSGQELNRMLHDAGIMRSECYTTNVVNARPPYNDLSKWVAMRKADISPLHRPLRNKMVLPIVLEGFASLREEIDRVRPNIIIALGNLAMWALTGQWGILKWRGSYLYSDPQVTPERGIKVIPTIHPAAILREYSLRAVAVLDLKRVARNRGVENYVVPKWNFIIRPSFAKVMETLDMLEALCFKGPTWIDFDLETSPLHITCAGLAWSRLDAICVPITGLTHSDHYWSAEEEGAIIYRLWQLLTNQNCWVRGQNILYDCQHTYRWWHFVPNVKQDTMISHHSMFCGMKKSLDFQASMYSDYYVYWKEMHKDQSNKAGA